ncbi:Hpt domain-containing protein [Demequina sp. NBRC 110054]|uniref:Hpt domain-containing protein n=1 Tax=Demequina sp. NBRC 110054 TaxID=1570343 RepID=UPI0009FCD004|nr:Hpt domain-containing protein [Demequina sp. NBRC 110054]
MSAQDPSAIIAALWERFRPTVAERLATLEEGLAAIRAGASGSDQAIRDAHRAAHNLAGALGSYERPEGSVVARTLMAELGAPRPGADTVEALIEKVREHCV